jgi:hypothetical protein
VDQQLLKGQPVKREFIVGLGWLAGCSSILASTPAAIAVQPPTVRQHDDVSWSRPNNNSFDGAIVYDKNYTPGSENAFVSSWSRQMIRARYELYEVEVLGYQTVMQPQPTTIHNSDGRTLTVQTSCPVQQPITRLRDVSKVPASIQFSIGGQLYTYVDGAVSDELAAALANAPSETNLTIRLVWQDGSTTDMTIGKRTIAAWKTIFSAPLAPQVAPSPSR